MTSHPDHEEGGSTRDTFFALLWMVRNFLGSEVGLRAKWMLAALFTLLFCSNGLNVFNSYVGRDFMTAIEHRSMAGFIAKALLYVGVFAVSTAVAVLYTYAEQSLALLWRRWQTDKAVQIYLAHRTYLWVKTNSALENPDQRIAEDIKTLSGSTLSLLLMVSNSVFTVVAFAGVLWSINPVLFVVAVGYAALGSCFTVLLGRPLVWRTYKQFDYEAALRSDLVHVRENAESIALRHAEHGLSPRLRGRVAEVCDNMGRIIRINRNLGFFTTGYNYLIQIIPALIVAPMFIHGSVSFGVIPQSAMAFTALVSAFSLIVNQVQSISNYVAVAARVKVTIDAAVSASKEKSFDIRLANDASRLALENLTLCVAGRDRPLVRDLSLEVAPGSLVLVRCAQAASATALFHAVAGLWDCGAGAIIRPGLHNIVFLPGKPYLPPGTLRQAMQASARHPAGEEDIRAVLAELGAGDIIGKAGGMDVEREWASLLSLGEQQLVSVAGIALAAPAFAVIELIETTLSHAQLRHVFSILQRKGVSVLVIDQEHSGLEGFQEVVEIDDQGLQHTHG